MIPIIDLMQFLHHAEECEYMHECHQDFHLADLKNKRDITFVRYDERKDVESHASSEQFVKVGL